MADQTLNTYGHAAAVTKHDTNALTTPADAILVVVAGTVKLVSVSDDTVTFTASVPVGTVIPIRTKQVFSTGTAATVVALYND